MDVGVVDVVVRIGWRIGWREGLGEKEEGDGFGRGKGERWDRVG